MLSHVGCLFNDATSIPILYFGVIYFDSIRQVGGWSNERRLNAILETEHLADEALNEYCRLNGIYTHQLTQWKEDFMSSKNDESLQAQIQQQQEELKQLKAAKKDLEKELKYKDKALAEASALLVLKKKADLIWGENEDD